MTKVIFVRHGRTFSNQEKRYGGHTNVHLNEIGEEQAKKVAQRLKDYPLQAIYASDLQRAFVTASVIAKEHDLTVTALPALRELNFGVWEGKTHQEIMAEDAKLVQSWFENPFATRIPEGETMADLQTRIVGCVQQIIDKHPEETVLIVTHAGPIWVMLSHVLGIPPTKSWCIKIENTSINIIEFHEHDQGVVCLINDSAHI